MTGAELRLWLYLRKPGIPGLRFRRQTPIGPYIVDFFCPSQRLIVEVDGSQHFAEPGVGSDAERDQWLLEQGYRIVRVSNLDVMANLDGVHDAIVAAAASRVGRTPSRNLHSLTRLQISTSPQGGG